MAMRRKAIPKAISTKAMKALPKRTKRQSRKSTPSPEDRLAEELLGLENQYWRAVQDHDVEKAMSLTDDPCIVAGASGVGRIDRKSFAKIMEGSPAKLYGYRLRPGAKVRRLTDDVAILAYEVHEDMTVNGHALSMDASDASLWVRRDGKWKCALHTESLAGDPYGRDKRGADDPSKVAFDRF
jgi:hypothetical protein